MHSYWLSTHRYLLFCRYGTHLIMAWASTFKSHWKILSDNILIDNLKQLMVLQNAVNIRLVLCPPWGRWSLKAHKIYIRSIFSKQIAHNTMEAPGLDSSADGAGYIYWNALFVIEPPPTIPALSCLSVLQQPIAVGPPSRRFKAPCYCSSMLHPLFTRFNKCFQISQIGVTVMKWCYLPMLYHIKMSSYQSYHLLSYHHHQ